MYHLYEILDMEQIKSFLEDDFLNKVNAEFDLAFQDENN